MVVDRLWDILESIRDCHRIATREGTYLRQYVLVISGALHYTCPCLLPFDALVYFALMHSRCIPSLLLSFVLPICVLVVFLSLTVPSASRPFTLSLHCSSLLSLYSLVESLVPLAPRHSRLHYSSLLLLYFFCCYLLVPLALRSSCRNALHCSRVLSVN